MPLFKTIIIAMVLALSSAVSYANQQEESEALFLAAHIGHLPSVAAAVDNGANVNYMNSDRETAMHAAASRGHLHVIQYFLLDVKFPAKKKISCQVEALELNRINKIQLHGGKKKSMA